ncbi:uncharacterized protein EI90DRAFT_3050571 [Cantharellus anzutake]|uniref:uncharacterized protein n=1 Tax=Cantharellus anzutake TaxID=1750568 RepID=UPI001906FDA6|nr:uncharacterized protein EI90DRAFT_3050571 [Cantharellus anzutake]KAF8333986.1 hypothetical protein EI90DRAFT_3050571 [Cantharellus anzutake]
MSAAEFQVDPHPLEMLERSPIVQGDTVVVRETTDMASELSKQDVEPKELRPHGLDPSVITDYVEYMVALKVGDASADHALEFFRQSEDPHPGRPNMYIVIPRVREHEVKELRPPGLSDELISEVPDEGAVEATRVPALDREITVNDKRPTRTRESGVESRVVWIANTELCAKASEISNSPHESAMGVKTRHTVVPNPPIRPLDLQEAACAEKKRSRRCEVAGCWIWTRRLDEVQDGQNRSDRDISGQVGTLEQVLWPGTTDYGTSVECSANVDKDRRRVSDKTPSVSREVTDKESRPPYRSSAHTSHSKPRLDLEPKCRRHTSEVLRLTSAALLDELHIAAIDVGEHASRVWRKKPP